MSNENESALFAEQTPMPDIPSAYAKNPYGRAPLIVSLCALAIALACGAASIAIASADKPIEEDAGLKGTVKIDDPHEHDWAIQYETIVHDEVSHEEIVQPVYETITTMHSVCNECNEIVDGRAQEHVDATGHSGYSTNVPVSESRLVSEGRIDVIIDEPAYEELVATGHTCTICGESS